MNQDNIKSVTLRVAIFFGLTTFTLCIAIFYIETILDDTKSLINQRDSIIDHLHVQIDDQQNIITELENEAKNLKSELDAIKPPATISSDIP